MKFPRFSYTARETREYYYLGMVRGYIIASILSTTATFFAVKFFH